MAVGKALIEVRGKLLSRHHAAPNCCLFEFIFLGEVEFLKNRVAVEDKADRNKKVKREKDHEGHDQEDKPSKFILILHRKLL